MLIDVFSKYAVVVPLKSQEPPDVLAGLMEGLNKMDKNQSFFTATTKEV